MILGVLAYKSISERFFESALDSGPWRILVYCNNPEKEEFLSTYERYNQVDVQYAGRNEGVASGWNALIARTLDLGKDSLMIANDDIVFRDHLMAIWEPNQYAGPDCHITMASPGPDGDMGYAFFGLTKFGIEKVGFFDRNFWPAYYEDNDYERRAQLLGMSRQTITEFRIDHEGSGSIKKDKSVKSQIDQTFLKNQDYYLAKWGGIPDEEVYQTPFNLDLSLKIGREQAGNPYPGVIKIKRPRLQKMV